MRSRFSQFLTLGVLLAISARFGTPQSAPAAVPCTVTGTVINGSTHQPIRKARVQMNSGLGVGFSQTIVTADDGGFEFVNIPAGQYMLQAEATGYVLRMNESPWRALTLAPGEQRRDVVLSLLPEAVISGRVLDDQGDPVMDAMVYAFVPVYSNHRRRFVLTGQGGTGQTDERGAYRLYNLSPGSYTLVAIFRRKDDPRPVTTPPTFYPDVSDPDESSPITVEAGEEATDISFNLVVSPAVCVRGRASVASAPKTTIGSFVELVPQNTWALPWMANDSRYRAQSRSDKGEFQVCGVPTGSYLALASANDRTNEHFYSGRAPVEVGSTDVNGVSIVVDPIFDLRGRVRTDPAAQTDFSHVMLYLVSQDRESSAVGARVTADGTFVMHQVADAYYFFSARNFPPEFYLKSARLGGADLLASGMVVNYSMASATLDVVLSPNGGQVDGSVLDGDGKPVANADVEAVPDEAHRNRDEYYRSARSDAAGKFNILGLAPGDYTLYATDKDQYGSFKDPDFLQQIAGQGATVEIDEKQHQSVQLTLIQIR